jgi:3-hydroxyisobutyrate dehydrogenase-like beta-hydroxyacid dehydrogenase
MSSMANDDDLVVGFLGFGVAGSSFASDLNTTGVTVFAYDNALADETYGCVLRERASKAHVDLVSSPRQLARVCDTIVSTVATSASVEAATSIAPFLTHAHLYVDMNSSSPERKRQISRVVGDSGARFVDAAVMGEATQGIRVRILVCGDGAAEFSRRMSKYGMNIQPVDAPAGGAAAIKMVRSIFAKGVEALLLETLVAAHRGGLLGPVIDSLAETMDSRPFVELLNSFVTSDAIHAQRRANEMDQVVATLQELGVRYTMSEATKSTLEWSAGLGLKEHFNFEAPKDYLQVLEWIRARQERHTEK